MVLQVTIEAVVQGIYALAEPVYASIETIHADPEFVFYRTDLGMDERTQRDHRENYRSYGCK